jgi:hypothetical protein
MDEKAQALRGGFQHASPNAVDPARRVGGCDGVTTFLTFRPPENQIEAQSRLHKDSYDAPVRRQISLESCTER